jgi:hypothetical protein
VSVRDFIAGVEGARSLAIRRLSVASLALSSLAGAEAVDTRVFASCATAPVGAVTTSRDASKRTRGTPIGAAASFAAPHGATAEVPVERLLGFFRIVER